MFLKINLLSFNNTNYLSSQYFKKLMLIYYVCTPILGNNENLKTKQTFARCTLSYTPKFLTGLDLCLVRG